MKNAWELTKEIHETHKGWFDLGKALDDKHKELYKAGLYKQAEEFLMFRNNKRDMNKYRQRYCSLTSRH